MTKWMNNSYFYFLIGSVCNCKRQFYWKSCREKTFKTWNIENKQFTQNFFWHLLLSPFAAPHTRSLAFSLIHLLPSDRVAGGGCRRASVIADGGMVGGRAGVQGAVRAQTSGPNVRSVFFYGFYACARRDACYCFSELLYYHNLSTKISKKGEKMGGKLC